MRRYAAIELTWTRRPDEQLFERLAADLDGAGVRAIDDGTTAWRAFFDSAESRDRALAGLGGLPGGLTARAVDVPDEGWAERSQASLSPVRVGRLVILPPWRVGDPPAPGVDHAIVINPSMGFGTGHHASTRLALGLLQSFPVSGCTVIDVGTGSGVLAVAAWKLGAADVEAIDCDADALAAARDTCERNQATSAVHLRRMDLSAMPPGRTFDLVLANLTGATLVAHGAALLALTRPAGQLVASGVESEEADSVVAALAAAGFDELARESEDGWVGLRFERPATSPSGPRAS